MARWPVLLRCVAQALRAQGLRALAEIVPLGAVLYDVTADACQRLREEQQDDEIEALMAQAAGVSTAEVLAEAARVSEEVLADQPEALRGHLAGYLAHIPGALRRSARAAGASGAVSFAVRRPEDLLQFLPGHLPRFKAGDRPAGLADWELVELLGAGGFGEVWLARHAQFDALPPVALKFCLDPQARDRLLRHEAVVINQVMRHGRHPGIVPLLDAVLSTDPPCLKYEYVEGGDLAGLIRVGLPEGPGRRSERAAALVAELAGIVGFTHRLSPPVVHRDLKPANILVEEVGGTTRLRVTDFGIGALAATPGLEAARRGTTARAADPGTALRGAHTPFYASPQQVRGEAPDPRDDIHALGVIWYQLLMADLGTGAPTGLWADDLEEAGVPRELVRLLGACVHPKPERRPADGVALADALATLTRPAPVVLPPPPAPLPTPLPAVPVVETRLGRFLRTGNTGAISWMLDLTNQGVGDAGVAALAASPRLAGLATLILSGNAVGDGGVQALAGSAYIGNLTRLVLWDNWVGDAGVASLAGAATLANLTHLDIGRNRVGDEGIQALAASSHMARLEALILVSNHIGDPGALALAASESLSNLAELKPLENRITPTGVTALKARFGRRVRIY